MSALNGITARLRSLLHREDSETRMDEEFRFHLDLQTEKHIARGMAPEQARRQALIDFGGVERHRESLRDEQRPRLLAEVAQDARFTVRALRHNRIFAITTVLIVALGVGVTTALFSVANALLFRDLPVPAPDDLYVLQEERRGPSSRGMEGTRISYARYEAYRDATDDLFDGLAAHVFQPLSLRANAAATPVYGALTSGNYFGVLGLTPAAGGFYQDDREPSAVLSDRAWRQQFDGDPSAVGRLVTVDGRPYTIAAIAPRGFGGTVAGLTIDVWIPYRAHTAADSADRHPWVGMFGRVRNHGVVASAATRLTTIATQMPPEDDDAEVERAYLTPLSGLPEIMRAPIRGFIGMLMGAGVLVLLIGGANIASLLLARAVARRREIALRLSLGAGRGRLVRQLLTESTLLFLLGGIGGVALAYIATGLLSRLSLPGVPVSLQAALDLRVLAFALGIAALTGLVFGLVPAIRAVRLQLVGALKEGGATGGTARMRARSVFVGAQVAFAMLLLITAGLFVRGLQRALAFDPGIRPDGVVVGSFNLGPYGLTEPQGRVLQAELLRRVRSLPEVMSASLATVPLLTRESHANAVSTVPPASDRLTSGFNVVDTAYFGTMGVELVAGRSFGSGDTHGAPQVVVVNQMLARRLWADQNPLGQRMWSEGEEYEVIGVARDGKYVHLGEEQQPFMFFASAQHYANAMTLHVRTRGSEARLIESIREELRAVHPDVALELAMPLPQMIGFTLLPQRMAAGLIGVFGVLGLVLATAGVYGVMAYQVTQRTREFGIRLALGARAGDVARMVVRGGLLLSLGGALAGTALAVVVTRLISGMLFGLSALDPVTYGMVAAALVAVAVTASWIPARRVFRVDPTVSLRAE